MSPTAAFFGATGGCANACLAFTLKAGYTASALARTPSKLTNLLLSQGIDQETIDANLTIIQGDATDLESVKSALLPDPDDKTIAPIIISGLGSCPKLQGSVCQPVTLQNPTICEDATKTLLEAVRQIRAAQPEFKQPLLLSISTTGISGIEDVPFAVRAMYHYFLAVPHKDKRKMEDLAFASNSSVDPSERPFKAVIFVRPSFLVGDQNISSGKGYKTLRVGTEEKPAVGYTVSRADVGEWISKEIIQGGGEKWFNKCVTLTS